MKEYVIKSFGELHDIIDRYGTQIMVYRGVKSVNFDLLPKIGRITHHRLRMTEARMMGALESSGA